MRHTSFGKNKVSLVDRCIVYIRTKQIRPYLKKVDCIVDIGCGYNPTLLLSLQEEYNIKTVIGVDLYVNSEINSNNFILQEKNMNYDSIDLSDGLADIVVSLAVLEHLDEPLNLLKEVYRVLSPGGVLVLTTPSPYSKPILELISTIGLINKIEIDDHKNYFNGGMLKEMMLRVGFTKSNIVTKTFLFGLNNLVVCYKQ